MKKLFISLVFLSVVYAQPLRAPLTWAWTGRVHPELDWYTISTDNFNVHYHQDLEEIARRGAVIAENVLPTLLKQMDLDSIPTIDIVFTAADEVANGFASYFYSTFIWVGQNDTALRNEGKKWLGHVLPHELQHIVLLHRTRTWLPSPINLLVSEMPGWVVEGTAEYETEEWRPYRADLQHKIHVLRNNMDEMDPHHDGFSKMLYWSDRFGDSTIVETLKWRNFLKIFRFPEAFKKATGITVSQFEEDWRRHMNTYYYGVRSQKEPMEEVGEVVSLPIERMFSFMFSPDSSKIALMGLDDKNQRDMSLIIAERDTAGERKALEEAEAEKDTTKEKVKPKVLWKKKEVDFGRFHQSFSWSPNGRKIAYSKYHFGDNQSSVWDIRVYDIETGRGQWLTDTRRATYPIWSPDGKTMVYVSHRNGVANLYKMDSMGGEAVSITSFSENTQILTPAWSPKGESIAFAKAGSDENLDLWLLDLQSGETNRLTEHVAVDIQPVWAPDGASITFSSHRSGTPNIHTISLGDLNLMQNTDVGEAIIAFQRLPNDSTVYAMTLGDVDSVRIVKVWPKRTITTSPLSIMDSYTDWRKARPHHQLEPVDFGSDIEITEPKDYRFTKHLKHVTTMVIPDFNTIGITQWIDGLGRHLFTVGGLTDFKTEEGSGLFLSYQNAQHGPLWSVSYFFNTLPVYRPYDGSRYGLLETKNGLQLRLFHPFNRGESLSSNHIISSSVSLMDRQPMVSDSINWFTGEWFPREEKIYGEMPIPEAGREALFSLEYRWVDRRPHALNNLLPRKGKGLMLRAEKATSSVFGTFDYTRLTADGFVNIPVGPTAFFLRVKGVALSGAPPAHDYLGLTNDAPVYLSVPLGDLAPSLSEFLPENHNPRGWSGTRLGNRLVFGTAEYRVPVIPKVVSLALISDFGNVWNNGEEADKLVMTAGLEGKLAFGPIVFALGQAQSLDGWGDGGKPDQYFRLALINPF